MTSPAQGCLDAYELGGPCKSCCLRLCLVPGPSRLEEPLGDARGPEWVVHLVVLLKVVQDQALPGCSSRAGCKHPILQQSPACEVAWPCPPQSSSLAPSLSNNPQQHHLVHVHLFCCSNYFQPPRPPPCPASKTSKTRKEELKRRNKSQWPRKQGPDSLQLG